MTPKRSPKVRAAAVIRLALLEKNYQDCDELRKCLAKYRLGRDSLCRGVRVIRDAYGEHALVTKHDGRRVVYVIDPDRFEGRAYANEMGRRALTETEHVLELCNWLAKEYGNNGFVRAARRYGRNMVEELREFVGATANGDGGLL